MSYTVLARKWRPKSFTELVGQEHVQRAIVNAIDQNRLHHAYLFTGTRGVGKTTIARIFSKCLNCESGITSAPCGTCAICQEIDGGHFVDLIEVDVASRTKVEDTREILDNVQYRPSRGRYKVYLIDEVHMLSNSSFNALLKTLEEPPPHVVFLLATTDPQKLPVTVLSRCLQFHLKRMTPQAIVAHLAHVLTAESISFDETSLQMIGQAADGSMRDALSLLDQAIAFGGGQLEQKDVADMLGAVDHQFIGDIIEHLAHQNAAGLLDVVNAMSEFSPDYQAVMSELLSTFHQMAVSKLVGENTLNNERLGKWLEQLSSEDIQLFYQLGIQARKDLPLAPDPRQGFEMALIRMLAFKPVTRATISQPNPAQSSQQPDVSAQKKTLNLDGHSIDSRTQAVDSHKQSVEHDRQRASRSRDDSTRSNRTEPSDEVNQNQSFTNNNLGSPENTLLPTEADASSSVDSPRWYV